eukprot:tig00020675_g12661.t1
MPERLPHTNSEKLPSQVIPGSITNPSYTLDFGPYGWNPRERTPGVPREISLKASTVDLFSGTPKSTTYHIPGYAGFLPSSEDNPRANDPGFRGESRETTKKYLRITPSPSCQGIAAGRVRPGGAFGSYEVTKPAVAPEYWGLPKIKSTFGRPSTQIHKRLLATSGRMAGGTTYTSTCDY